jgi:hypothetical protein
MFTIAALCGIDILTSGKMNGKHRGWCYSAWSCGSSESRGDAILLSKHFACDINFNFSDKNDRLLKCEVKTENVVSHISNICVPNLCNDRK